MKKKIDYSVSDIWFYYEDIVDKAVSDGKIKDKNEAITLINVIVYCNVDILDYNKVLFLLEKAIELIHSNNQDTCSFEYWIAKSDYSTIIYYLITIYYPDNKKEKIKEEYVFDIVDEDKFSSNVKKRKKN